VRKADIDTAFKRLSGFLEKALGDYHKGMEEASSAFDMALRIYDIRAQLTRVRLHVFTDGLSTVEQLENTQVGGLTVSHHVWDIERIFRLQSSGQAREAIEIDFIERGGHAIPCLEVPAKDTDYRAFLAVFPGDVIADLYGEFRDRLLERNVRSFLQARGKVNKGIRDTIVKAPHRFMAYNNGISGTASDIELVRTPDGGLGIKRVRDLQIVNGGQTTASIFHAKTKDRADISQVFVQAKLSVVDTEKVELDELVPLISRFANSQNKVSEPDFSANDPIHIELERLSRTVWAPALPGQQRQTKWFYERARGQFVVAKNLEGSNARQKAFVEQHPPSQRITKTDWAKFENTWYQMPHIVSRGGEKNYKDYMVRFQARNSKVDQTYFEHLVARSILFRQAESLVQAMQFGGYRANIVTYTIAYLSYKTAQRIDLGRIWREQNITLAIAQAIKAVAPSIQAVIISPPGGKNVTEWCKKEECWKSIQQLDIKLPAAFEEEVLGFAPVRGSASGSETTPLTDDEAAVVAQIRTVSSQTWFDIAVWAKETGNLQIWQRGIAASLGKLASRGKDPSIKQALHGSKILKEVVSLGFDLEASAQLVEA
jgi:hypothetical protein